MKICMYGFSGQNMNLWLKYFRDHTVHEIVLFTPSFSPSREYSFPRLRVIEIEKRGNRLLSSLFARYIRARTSLFLRRNRFDLVIMQGLYNRSFAPFLFLRAKAGRKVITVWNDINHRRIARGRNEHSNSRLLEALSQADLILPTWKPARDAFADEFPELADKMVVKSWGTNVEMLPEATVEPDIPDSFRKAMTSSAPLLFWPRTIREGIRHDLLLEALSMLNERSVGLVSVLPMGKAGDSSWDRKILSLLEKTEGQGFIAADHSGHIPLKELREIYRRADLMVNLADSDQVSSCVAEAFLFELDVILSDIPPYRALCEMGFSAKLVPNDRESIADAIEEAVSLIDSEVSRSARKENRRRAQEIFDLKTNLDSLVGFAMEAAVPPGRNLLFMAPGSPPFGGVADQSTLLRESRSLSRKFKITHMRTNPGRETEDPSRKRTGSIGHFLKLLGNAAFRSFQPRPDAIQLIANGDISFIRDMIVAMVIKLRNRVPLAVHLHGSRKGFWHDRSAGSEPVEPQHRSPVKEKLGYTICRMLLKKADSLTQLTGEIDGFYRQLGFPEADCIIPNGVAQRPNEFSPGKPGYILFVGRLSREKGFPELLEALEYLEGRDWQLDVLGEYPSDEERNSLEERLSNHSGKGRIHLHGAVTGRDKWDYYKGASILVLPTRIDVFPVVILEGMAFGCAIVTTRTGEIPGIAGSENFDFVKPGSPETLAKVLEKLLVDTDECTLKGRRNHLSSLDYTIEKTAELLGENIEKLIEPGESNG